METDRCPGDYGCRTRGPTRWGNQLNGNISISYGDRLVQKGPTRWGNQLNGNQDALKFILIHSVEAPLAGAIS